MVIPLWVVSDDWLRCHGRRRYSTITLLRSATSATHFTRLSHAGQKCCCDVYQQIGRKSPAMQRSFTGYCVTYGLLNPLRNIFLARRALFAPDAAPWGWQRRCSAANVNSTQTARYATAAGTTRRQPRVFAAGIQRKTPPQRGLCGGVALTPRWARRPCLARGRCRRCHRCRRWARGR